MIRQNAASFYAVGTCKNSSCVTFNFRTTERVEYPYREINISVLTSSNTICHKVDEVHRREVTGESRKTVAKELEIIYPCKMELLMLAKVDTNVFDFGNQNNALSKMILQKIFSENNSKTDLHPNFYHFMVKLIDETDGRWIGKKFNGYIQSLSFKPFYVILFTERQLQYLLKLLREGKKIFLYFDATGTLIACLPGVDGPIYTYVVCLPGEKDIMPLPCFCKCYARD